MLGVFSCGISSFLDSVDAILLRFLEGTWLMHFGQERWWSRMLYFVLFN